jgi:phage terminase large subunit GpA-like protein
MVGQTSPIPGRWRSDSSPWVREVMEVFADNRVTDETVMCSAQSAKTETALGLACWSVSEDPGPTMWVTKAQDEVKQFVKDRAGPTFATCEPVARSITYEGVAEYRFSGMPFYFTGAGSPSKLQSKPIRWLFLDEVRNYPKGALDLVAKRTRAFWNARRFILSTAGDVGDDVHRAFLDGDQREFCFACPSCGKLQPFVVDQLKARHPETGKAVQFSEVPGVKDEAGIWNFDLLAEHLRYQCAGCGELIRDEPVMRRRLANAGRFVPGNPKAPRHRVSFHWNAFLPPWVQWRSIAEEHVSALAAAKGGDLEPMKTFWRETLGLPWEDKLGEIDDFEFLEARRDDYDFGDRWPEERVRFMAVDCQEAGGEHYWYVVRAFGHNGKSRLITYGRCNTLTEVEETRERLGVPVANSMIDSGHKAARIYRFCVSNGWKALKGDSVESYTILDKSGRRVRRSWRRTFVDPFFGRKGAGKARPIPLYSWSNDSIKDELAEMMRGNVGEWTIPRTSPREYMRQVTAEERRQHVDAKGRVSWSWDRRRRDNHLFDCECMITVGARAGNVLQAAQAVTKRDVPPLVDGKRNGTESANNGGDGSRQAPG